MPPSDERFDSHDRAGPQVDLGQIVQQQRVVVDFAPQVQLDVVAEEPLQRYVIAGHCDVVTAGPLGRQNGLVRAMQKVAGVVAARHAHCDTDADGAADHVTAEGHPIAQCRAQFLGGLLRHLDRHRPIRHDDELVSAEAGGHAFGAGLHLQLFGECPDEPVTGGVAEIVVDRLQPVQVEIQHRDGARLTCRQSFGQVRHQRAAVVQAGQIVVFGELAELLLGSDTGLELRQQGCDRLDGVELIGPPFLATKFHADQLAGGDASRHQGRCRCRRRRDLAGVDAPTLLRGRYPARTNRIGGLQSDHRQFLAVLAQREDRVGAAEVGNRRRVGD